MAISFHAKFYCSYIPYIFSFHKKWTIILPVKFKLVFYRTLFLLIAMLIYFGSLAFFPISQVAAGLFTSPIFVIIFSNLLYREKLNLIKIIAVCIGSLGAILVLDVNIYEFTFMSVLPVAGGAFYALSSITTWYWCKKEDPRALMFMFFVGMGLVSFIFLILLELNSIFTFLPITKNFITLTLRPVDILSLIIITMHAFISVIGGILITYGYQKGHTSFVAIFEYSFLFFVTFWGFLFFSDIISIHIVFGMLLIVLSGSFLSSQEKLKQKNSIFK